MLLPDTLRHSGVRLKLLVTGRRRSYIAYNVARCLAHSAVLSEDLLGSNPTGIAQHSVPTHAVALARKRSHPSHVRRRKFSAFFESEPADQLVRAG